MPDPIVTVQKSPYALLRNRDFAFYLVGRLFASFGSQMLVVAVGWEIFERTHSALMLGLVGLTQFLPQVLMTLPAGHLADTRERKRLILQAQAIMTAASLGLAIISLLKADVAWMFGCLFIGGIARTFLWSASASFLPLLVEREDFPRAVTWSAGTFQFSSVAGPALSGALIAMTHSAAPIYLFNTMAGATCFTLVLLVRVHHKPNTPQEITWRGLLGGFAFVFSTRVMLAAITLDLFAVLFGGATALLPQYAKDVLGVNAAHLGLLQAALPIGSLVCALHFAHRAPMEKAGRALLWSVVVFGLATIAFGYSKSFWLSMLMLFICGYADNISVLVRHTLVQMLTPDEMRGRVSAVNNLFIGTSNELGGFESGAVSHWRGPVFSIVSGGIATIIVVLGVAWIWPELRNYGKLVPPEK